MFRVVPSPIIRSANNCIYSIWYLLHRYCYLPLSWKSWNWFECAVGGVRHPQHTSASTLINTSWILNSVIATIIIIIIIKNVITLHKQCCWVCNKDQFQFWCHSFSRLSLMTYVVSADFTIVCFLLISSEFFVK